MDSVNAAMHKLFRMMEFTGMFFMSTGCEIRHTNKMVEHLTPRYQSYQNVDLSPYEGDGKATCTRSTPTCVKDVSMVRKFGAAKPWFVFILIVNVGRVWILRLPRKEMATLLTVLLVKHLLLPLLQKFHPLKWPIYGPLMLAKLAASFAGVKDTRRTSVVSFSVFKSQLWKYISVFKPNRANRIPKKERTRLGPL